jgi:dihydroflavonol-4-reductase
VTARKALVTGGTGFVGANLVAGLNARGIDARVLHRPTSSMQALEGLSFESVPGDVLDNTAALAEAMAGCDWVFHAAAVADYWRQDTGRLYEVNVEGTRRVVAAARQAGVSRLIFTSSLAALGVPPKGKMLNEDSRFNLEPDRFPYAHSKHLAELEVLKASPDGPEAVIINPTIVLGPRDVNLISGSLILEAAGGRMWFYPPGGVNYVDVADVVAVHLGAAESAPPGERYIVAGMNLTFKEAFGIICGVVGRRKPWLPLPGPLMPLLTRAIGLGRRLLGQRIPMDDNQVWMSARFIYADGSKARRAFDLRSAPFEETVRRTYAWYRSGGYLPPATGQGR